MKTEYVYATEMSDPVMNWPAVDRVINEGHPVILYSKATLPIDYLKDKSNVAIGITISGWGGTWLEPNVFAPNVMIDYFNKLIKEIPIERVLLRVDPVIPTTEGFLRALRVIKGIVGKPRVISSIIQYYSGHEKIFHKLGISRMITYKEKHGRALFPKKIVAEMWIDCVKKTRPDLDITLCGMPYEVEGAIHDGCVNENLLRALSVEEFVAIEPGFQRPGCKCVIKKRQIYLGRCNHGCAYCYANKDNARIIQRSGDEPVRTNDEE